MKHKAALAGLAVSGLWFVLHVTGVGGLHFQVTGYRLFAPVLSAFPAYLNGQVAQRYRHQRAGSFWRWSTAAWITMTLASLWSAVAMLTTGDMRYPTGSPVVSVLDTVTLVLVLVGLMRIPVRTQWAGSRLRLGLDMLTVLIAGLVFLWYFVVEPAGHGGFGSVVTFVQTAGAMVVLFAIARLAIAGVAEISRAALMLFAAAAVADVMIGVIQSGVDGDDLHFALAAWALFCTILIMSSLLQLRAAATGTPAAHGKREPSSLLPYVAIVAVFTLVVNVLVLDGLTPRTWSALGGAIALTAIVVVRQIVAMRDNNRLLVRLDHSLDALRESMGREQVLADLGTALLRTTDAAEVHDLAVRAAGDLLADVPGGRAALVGLTSEDLLSGGADDRIPADVLKSLQALRTQVSLALAGVALTAELTMQAMQDALTGLGNRALLRDRLTAALARAKRSDRTVAALLLDLNDFKPVNDRYGHDTGDELLKVVADRLRQSVRTEDTVGRLGGDEFVVIAEDLHSPEDAFVIAERIVDSLNEAVLIAGARLTTPASIGIAISHDGTTGPDDLLREADTAMYEAKRQGGGHYRLFVNA